MEKEFFDLVDESNNLTGKSEARDVVHSTGLWHRTVHIYFFREIGEEIQFLVQLRAKTKDINPDKWDTRIGGHIKAGTDLKDAVLREINEEVGIDVNYNDLIDAGWRKRENFPNNEFTRVFFLNFKMDLNSLEFKDAEVQEAKWLLASDIKKELKENFQNWAGSADNFQAILKILEDKIKI